MSASRGQLRLVAVNLTASPAADRRAFYSHYRDKDALLLDGGLDHLRVMIADATAGGADTAGAAAPLLGPALVIFRLADSNRGLYRALIAGRGSELAVRAARTILCDVFAEHLRARLSASGGPQLDFMVAFLVSGLIGLLTWWLDNKVPLSADQMYDLFAQQAAHGISPLLP